MGVFVTPVDSSGPSVAPHPLPPLAQARVCERAPQKTCVSLTTITYQVRTRTAVSFPLHPTTDTSPSLL